MDVFFWLNEILVRKLYFKGEEMKCEIDILFMCFNEGKMKDFVRKYSVPDCWEYTKEFWNTINSFSNSTLDISLSKLDLFFNVLTICMISFSETALIDSMQFWL